MRQSMLKKARQILAVISLLLVTALFLDFTGTVHRFFGWMAKIQFLPALLALNVGVILVLVLLTLHSPSWDIDATMRGNRE